jgi:hypothetical protein
MKSSSAKNVSAAFFQLEETASGCIARCPDCGVRFAVNVKRDVVADEYLRLLVVHATGEQVTFESDEEIRNWLHGSEAKAKSFLGALEIAAAYADRYEYRVLRPTLFDLKAKCSPKSATEGSPATAQL